MVSRRSFTISFIVRLMRVGRIYQSAYRTRNRFPIDCTRISNDSEEFNIDFWEWYYIQPHYHYHLRDDPNPCVIVRDGKETMEPNYRKGERYDLSPSSIALQEKWYREDTQKYGRNPTFEMMFNSVKKDEWWDLESCIDPNMWTLGAIEWQIQF